ncbi:MAG: hypothetical protein SFW36_12100 [Leptolyngbyaceae cyanobacterium bins.59]|nr:hypothetical protein [Leptolyngbyaceae cyanobacterium bins.59]
MLEMIFLSLFVGSLGLQTTLIAGWQLWQQRERRQRMEEEEEVLARHEFHDYAASAGNRGSSSQPHPSASEASPRSNGASAASGNVSQSNPMGQAPIDPRLAGWEYKIVRAHRELFRNPAMLHRLCKEEAEAGWLLLEKLDDRRVRFKRPIAMREIIRPEHLSHDPYRCHFGPSSNVGAWLGALAFLGVTLTSAYLGYALVAMTMAQRKGADLPAQSFPNPQLPASPIPAEAAPPESGTAN